MMQINVRPFSVYELSHTNVDIIFPCFTLAIWTGLLSLILPFDFFTLLFIYVLSFKYYSNNNPNNNVIFIESEVP